MTTFSTPTRAAFLVAALATPLLATGAQAENTAAEVREAIQELKRSNDSAQAQTEGEGTAYSFSQSVPVLDRPRRTSPIYGFSNRSTPDFGTSASYPAQTYVPIPKTQSSFGLSFRF